MAMTSDRRVEQATEKAAGERGKAVEAAILAIEKQFGRGSIMRLGSAERQQVEFIPSGSIALDLALGVGGIPRGRVTEIFGPESSGKTTVCQHVIAEAQKRGGVAAFIDVEHALDPGYARACGVNVDELLVSPARHGRAGPRDHRDAHPLGRDRRRRRRLGRGPGAARRDRGRDGRLVRRHPGSPHEPGPAQAHRCRQPLEHVAHLHQPAAREDRGHVRQSRSDTRRARPQVLRLGPPRDPARRDDQDRHGRRRQPGPGQGREEQGRAALPGRRVRRHVRRGNQPRGRPPRRRRGDGRGHQDGRLVHVRRDAPRPGHARRRRASCATTRRSPPRSRAGSGPGCPPRRSRSRGSKRPSRRRGLARRPPRRLPPPIPPRSPGLR